MIIMAIIIIMILSPPQQYFDQVYGAGVVKVVQGLKIGNWTQEQLFR